MALFSFLFFTGLVAGLTWLLTRRSNHATSDGYFLAGRSLSWPFIAGSLLLTNLSTEQMVGLNGSAFADGLAVMAWEVVAVLALVAMALFFLPRFLQSGVTTVPEYLAQRFDEQTQSICTLIFLSAYALILLPIILYTGATGLIGILDIQSLLGIESRDAAMWLVIWVVGSIGSVYALFGGLKTVAVSDTLNSVGLLVGGLMITWFGLAALGDGSLSAGLNAVAAGNSGRLNSNGAADSSVPFSTLFSGVLLLHFFYWTCNQQIIQRTFGASSLAEGQKGVLTTGLLKLFGPLFLVLPGLIAFAMFPDLGAANADQAYGQLVNAVLPTALSGFFAAAMLGAILSSYNSALNSTCTLFSLGLYRGMIRQDATDREAVASGKMFGWIIAVFSMGAAPLLMGQESIFAYLQQMNGIYFIPILSVVLCGMLSPTMPSLSAKVGLILGPALVACGYFIGPIATWVGAVHEYHFLGMVFLFLVGLMLLIQQLYPRVEPWQQPGVEVVDMTPWRYSRPAGAALCGLVVIVYFAFADFA